MATQWCLFDRFEELEGWVDERVAKSPPVPLRTLQVGREGRLFRYVAGVAPTKHAAALVLIDPGFAESPLENIEILPLQSVG